MSPTTGCNVRHKPAMSRRLGLELLEGRQLLSCTMQFTPNDGTLRVIGDRAANYLRLV